MKKEVSKREFHKSRAWFIRGALYFFGLAKKPILSILDEYRSKSDAEKLAGDWYKVSDDIQKVYGEER
jgi:hypothetical protein